MNFEAMDPISERRHPDPLRCLTPIGLACAITSYHMGQIAPLATIIDEILNRDALLGAVEAKASGAVSRHGVEVLREDCDESDANQQEEQLEVLNAFLCRITVSDADEPDFTEGLEGLLRRMMLARSLGYAVFNLQWQPDAQLGLGLIARHVPAWLLQLENGQLYYTAGEKSERVNPGSDECNWMVARSRRFLGVSAAILWLRKHEASADFAYYSRRYGLPTPHGKTIAERGSEGWNNTREAIANLQGGKGIITDLESEIEILDFATSGDMPYEKIISAADRGYSILYRGSDLGTMSRSGERVAGASLQSDETEKLDLQNAAWISGTLNSQLRQTVLDYYFGPGTRPLVRFEVRTDPPSNLPQRLRIVEGVVDLGAPVSAEWASQEFNVPLAAEGETLLQSRQRRDASAPVVENQSAVVQNERPASVLQQSLAHLMGVQDSWLAELNTLFTRLEQLAEDDSLSEAVLVQAAERIANQFPELFGNLDTESLADLLEEAMGTAAVEGVVTTIRETV